MTCPTPMKSRFATQAAAESAAHRAALGVGKHLTPYQCGDACGWWHLTSKPRLPEPKVSLADIAELHQLDDADFRELVGNDARRKAAPLQSKALRDPSLAARWVRALKDLQRDMNAQLRLRSGDYSADTRAWRLTAATFQAALSERRAEAVEIIRVQGTAAVDPTGSKASERDGREAAGELAVKRLIDAHKAEFTQLLAEEYERLGVELPERIKRHQAKHAEDGGQR